MNSNSGIRGKISIKGWQSRWGANGTLIDHGVNLLTAAGNVDVIVESSTFHKANEGYINDFGYLSGGAKLINIGSKIGSSVVSVTGSSYINIDSLMQDGDGGVIKSSKTIASDLNNGAEDKAGMVIKQVNGATLNIPSGFQDVWGVSVYYGANATQGIQMLMLTTSDAIYKRRRTGVASFTGWVSL